MGIGGNKEKLRVISVFFPIAYKKEMKPVPNAGVLPKAGVEDAPNAGVEVPSGEG